MRASSVCGLLLLLLPPVAIAGEPPEPSISTLMDQASVAYRGGDHDAAGNMLHAVLERSPEHVQALYLMSWVHERAGRLDQAIAAAQQAHELGYVRAARNAYRLAGLHVRTGQPQRALDWLERSLELRFEDRPSIAQDDTFASLRDNVRFRRLAGMLPPGAITRDEGLRFDLDHLVYEARRMHAGPDRPAHSERFRRAVATLRARIAKLNDDQVLAAMMRLTALLGDGHSAIYGPRPDTPLQVNGLRLPYRFYLFPDGLHIIGGDGPDQHLGLQVLRFGELDADEVLRRMAAFRGVDNPMTWRWMGPQFYLGSLGLLRQVGATESADSVQLTLLAPHGRTLQVKARGGHHDLPRKLRPFPGTVGQPPLYLSRVDAHYWMQPMPEHRAIYVQFNQVRDAPDQSLSDFAAQLGQALASDGVDHVIVDVRHNNGGNNSLLRPLVRELIAFDVTDPDHRILVLTGRNTFSAAQNFINRLERWTDAEFVGEPSASSPNFVGEETALVLPYSRLHGSISSRYWQDSDPGDDRAWIPIDHPVELHAADYFMGLDPVLDAALAELQRRM